jgi:hypothetical protein
MPVSPTNTHSISYMAAKPNTPRYGLFYKSRGEFIGPYLGKSLTLRGWRRYPQNVLLFELRNNILKSQLQLRRVS